MTKQEVIDLLDSCSKKFHKVLSSHSATKIIAKEGHKLPTPMYESIQKKILSEADIDKLCADGFEECVRGLAALGATDVTIFECNFPEET